MQRQLIIVALLGVFSSASLVAQPAYANNRDVESALANYADVSVFYAALLNTGVLNELNENTHYTILAPTNEAFAEISPSVYPCFYSVQCRPQVAEVLRNHILVGSQTLDELVKRGEIPTIGRYRVYAESPYVGDYTIGNSKVLSGADLRDNMIYRIDGVIMHRQQLAQFRAMPPMANAVTEEKTVTTYRTPAAYAVPGGGFPAGTSEETVTRKSYVVPGSSMPAATSTTTVYPNGAQTRTYTTAPIPGGDGGDMDEETTVTRSLRTQP